ncbi:MULTISPECIES: lytic transglycosylase domain-containing protein [Paenibacillus]|uniref:Transglycosylase SLT domain-containing protein n=1 Tax=Paenibacillus cucumis (ex Kampfer et al. 2016) TaxID=1776858 RepID=A0ABS7KK30_9BACL|nr:lytic transglycosylase domain-containing protein [Paenibacillus cucumis (ex Kampfer et al. 2016)]MBY0204331.1 transglycosylase SLT domain-containing protein [Paenibacillus cucumis (ex Kampfer et al. 2016)]
MQIDPRNSRQLLELQLSNINNQTNGSAVPTGSTTDFSNMMDGLLNADNRSLSDAENQTSTSKRSNDGLLWLQLGSTYSPDTNITGSSQAGNLDSLFALSNTGQADSGKSVPTDFESLISQASAKYGVPESLIKAVIDTESGFNPNVVSSAGAKGLMQLMDGTAAGLGVSDSFDPGQNIDAGTKYLSLQLQRFGGQEKMALAAYNAGPGRLSRLGVTNDNELMSMLHLLPVETQNYITKVERARSKYSI